MTTPSTREAARTLAIAARGRGLGRDYTMLHLPYHENLSVHLSTDSHLLYLETDDEQRAVWDVEYRVRVSETDDFESPDYAERDLHETGTFYTLKRRVHQILHDPRRVYGSVVDVRISEPAIVYQLPLLRPVPDCVNVTCPECRIDLGNPQHGLWEGMVGPYHPACLFAVQQRRERVHA